MNPLILVSLGGILGSLLRWQIIETLPSFNLGVFLINQFGVLVAGIFAFSNKSSDNRKLFWITGFAGGFTTMSSLAFILYGSSVQSASLYATASLLTSYVILMFTKMVIKK